MIRALILTTLSGGAAMAGVLLFKSRLTARPKSLYFACMAVMLLFVIPFSPGLIKAAPKPAAQELLTAEASPKTGTADKTADVTSARTEETAEEDFIPSMSDMGRTPFTGQELVLAVWIAGAAFVFMKYMVSLAVFKHNVLKGERGERLCRLRTVYSDVYSPMLVGVFRPWLVLPRTGLSGDELEMAVQHERMHYRRSDPLLKLLGAVINSVHWFNPLSYFLVPVLDEACEYACDWDMLNAADAEYRKKYAAMLLNLVCRSSPMLSSNMARNKKQLVKRFEFISGGRGGSKKIGIITAIICVMAAVGSVALANTAYPILGGIVNKGYVEVDNPGGDMAYYTEDPVIYGGEIFVPLRQVLCSPKAIDFYRVDDDCVRYDKGKVTIDVWTSGITLYSENGQTKIPAKYSWSTSIEVGSTAAEIDGHPYTLSQPPTIVDAKVYVPFSYLQELRNYEKRENKNTNKFGYTLKQYDSMKNQYQTNGVNVYIKLGDEYEAFNSEASISKSGFRTEFNVKSNYFSLDDPQKTGTLEIVLEKVLRIFGNGSDLEGTFTVMHDGNALAYGQRGWINLVPSPEGKGRKRDYYTRYYVDGYAQGEIDFINYRYQKTETYAEKKDKVSAIDGTGKFEVLPEKYAFAVDTSTYRVEADTDYSANLVWFNPDSGNANVRLRFSKGEADSGEYRIISIDNDDDAWEVEVIDRDSFRGHFCVEIRDNSNAVRIDDFTGTVKGLSEGRFVLAADDDSYRVEGRLGEYKDIRDFFND